MLTRVLQVLQLSGGSVFGDGLGSISDDMDVRFGGRKRSPCSVRAQSRLMKQLAPAEPWSLVWIDPP